MSFSAKNGHISHLLLETEQKLYKKLDRRSIMGGDYQTFASCLRLPSDHLASINQALNPTEQILWWWKRKPDATIAKLINVLVKMDRLDCVDILKEDPLIDGRKDVKDTIQKYVEVSHEKHESFKKWYELQEKRKVRCVELIRLIELKASTYNKLCVELNGTLYQPSPPSTFSSLAEEMGYNMGKIREFKNSTNPTDALLQDWGKRPGNGVTELIEILKKVKGNSLAEMLEKEVEEILERGNLDVKPKRKADPTGKEGPEKKRKRKAR